MGLAPNPRTLIKEIRAVLGPEFVKPIYKKYRPVNAVRSWGCCYVASEALYHLLGRVRANWTPAYLRFRLATTSPLDPVGTHWFLCNGKPRQPGTTFLDPTSDQMGPVNYTDATRTGFLTKKPSARAAEVIRRVRSARRKSLLN